MTRLQQKQNSLSDDVQPLKDTSRKHTEDINTAKEDVSQLEGKIPDTSRKHTEDVNTTKEDVPQFKGL